MDAIGVCASAYSNAICEDLRWALTHIEKSDGVHLWKSLSWDPSSADHIIYCDACPEGMGFWYLVSKDGYYAPTPVNVPSDIIFYFEALYVLSALCNVQSRAQQGVKILIYTDNMNTVDIFCSLCCLLQYNHLLKQVVDILIEQDFSLQVLHVTGDWNIVVDALSRIQFSVILSVEPQLRLYSFHPPGLVGASGWFVVQEHHGNLLGKPGQWTDFSEKGPSL